MRISRATDSAEKKTDPAKEFSLAPWMHGDSLEHSNPVVNSNTVVKKEADVLFVHVSIKYAPQGPGEKSALQASLGQLSGDIDSGKLLKDLVAKLQGIPWGEVPNPHGTRIQVLLPEGVTPPNQEVLKNVLGMPSWVKGAIEFKNEPFKQPSAAQKKLFEQLSPPKFPNNSVPADQ